jgi:hypothetical protein
MHGSQLHRAYSHLHRASHAACIVSRRRRWCLVRTFARTLPVYHPSLTDQGKPTVPCIYLCIRPQPLSSIPCCFAVFFYCL